MRNTDQASFRVAGGNSLFESYFVAFGLCAGRTGKLGKGESEKNEKRDPSHDILLC
jgi:hypothetical protein